MSTPLTPQEHLFTTAYERGIYPNNNSYVMSSNTARKGPSNGGRGDGSFLRKATLYSVRTTTVRAYDLPSNTSYVPPEFKGGQKEIVTELRKQFQYNPPQIDMSIQMSPTDPVESILGGGALQSGSTIGIATTGIEMLFDRTLDTNAGRAGRPSSAAFAKLGVAKDILDVFAVVKGDPTLMEASNDAAATAGKSLTDLTSQLTDLVQQGSQILMGARVAIAYSPEFILYGLVQNMHYRFVKFNHNLIPTMGYVNLNIDIHNAGNTSLIRNEMAPPPLTDSTRSSPVPSPVQRPSAWSAGGGGSGFARPI
jgi:hypothetical protein